MTRVGDIVHYVMLASSMGEQRPAVVIKVWPDETVNLAVHLDSSDGYPSNQPIRRLERVRYGALHEPGTWHPMDEPDVVEPPSPDVETVINQAEVVATKAVELTDMVKALKPLAPEPQEPPATEK